MNNITSNTCRICAKQTENSFPLFSTRNNSTLTKLGTMFSFCLYEIQYDSATFQSVCHHCKFQLTMFYEFKRAAIETEEKYQMDLSYFKLNNIKDEINDDDYNDFNDISNTNIEIEYLKEEEEEYSEENDKINVSNFNNNNNNNEDTDQMKEQVEFENIYFDNNELQKEDYVTEEIIEDYLESEFDEENYEQDNNNSDEMQVNNKQDNQFQLEFLRNIKTDNDDSQTDDVDHTKALVVEHATNMVANEDDSDYIVEEEFEDLATMRKRKRKPAKPLPTNELNEYICRHGNCSGTFPSKYQLILHTRDEHVKKCELCDKKFMCDANLQAHLKTHIGKPAYECQYCHKGFNNRSTLTNHEYRHTNIRPHACSLCDKFFKTKWDLEIHYRVHKDIRNHVCEICGKAFRAYSHMSDHVETHVTENKYKCNECGQMYKTQATLKFHIVGTHNEFKYFCPVCNKGFGIKFRYNRHVKIHQRKNTYTIKKNVNATEVLQDVEV